MRKNRGQNGEKRKKKRVPEQGFEPWTSRIQRYDLN